MQKYVSLIIFILLSIPSIAQEEDDKQAILHGKVPASIKNGDSIYFSYASSIDKKYYEDPELASVIKNGKFKVKLDISYPHMYAIQFKSTKGKVPARGEFFIDNTTKRIEVDTLLGSGDVMW